LVESWCSLGSKPVQVIEARSNLSLTLDQLAAVFLGLSAFVLLVTLRPVLMGLWPIMVAAVLHLLVVGWCMRLAWRGNWARERFEINDRTLTIERYSARGQARSEWPTAWVRVQVRTRPMNERVIAVTWRGQQQVIGNFLPTDDKLLLANVLKEGLRPQIHREGNR